MIHDLDLEEALEALMQWDAARDHAKTATSGDPDWDPEGNRKEVQHRAETAVEACRKIVELVDGPPPVGRGYWQYGVEKRLPQWNNGEPYIEWGEFVGHDGYRFEHTEANASHRRMVLKYRTHYGEPELLPRKDS